MTTVNFTEFRKNASALFTAVEEGATIYVVRHGKRIAAISPIANENMKRPSWKKKRIRLTISGETLARAIVEERESGR